MNEFNEPVIRTECGWAGHFCLADKCKFKRNTHLEYKGTKVVVSTVGNLWDERLNKFENVGLDRQYETMAFLSDPDSPYDDIDPQKQIYLDSKWYISPEEVKGNETEDLEANKMHEACVREVIDRLIKGEIK